MAAMHRAEDLQDWIAQVTKQRCDEDHLSVVLQDGQLLCLLANALDADANLRVNKLRTAFHTRANVRGFLDWCATRQGLADGDCFQPDDLLDGSDFVKVLHTLSVLYDKLAPADSDTDSSSGSGPGSGLTSVTASSSSSDDSAQSSPVRPTKKAGNSKLAAFMRGGFLGRKKNATTPGKGSPSPTDTPEGTPQGTPPSTPPPLSPSMDYDSPACSPSASPLGSPNVPMSPFGQDQARMSSREQEEEDERQNRTLSTNARLNAFLNQVPAAQVPLQHPQRPAGPPKRSSIRLKPTPQRKVEVPAAPAPAPAPVVQSAPAIVTRPAAASSTSSAKFAAFLRANPPAAAPVTETSNNALPSPSPEPEPVARKPFGFAQKAATATAPAPAPAPASVPTRAAPVRVTPSDTFAQKKAMFMAKSTQSPVPMPRPETVAALTSTSSSNKLQAFISKQAPASTSSPATDKMRSQSKLQAFLAKTGPVVPPPTGSEASTSSPAMPAAMPAAATSALAAFSAQVKNNRALSSLAKEPIQSALPTATHTPIYSTPKPVAAVAAPAPVAEPVPVVRTPPVGFTPRKRPERSTGRGNFIRRRRTFWQNRPRPPRFSLEDKRGKFMHQQLELKEEQRRQKAEGGVEVKHNLIVPGVQCYVPDKDDVWTLAEIVDYDERHKIVTIDAFLDSGETERREVDLKDPATIRAVAGPKATSIESLPVAILHDTPGGVEDMRTLRYLNEPSILFNLKQRFDSSQPYTYTNDIVIAVNPYKWIDGLYGDRLHEQYLRKPRDSLRPHVYSTSTAAYKHMTSSNTNQSILVSGESGAGKTETTKILMNHLATVAGGREDKTIAKVIDVNPLLESFGNAKTTRNDNSSRFGKFTQLQFNAQGRLIGAKCETYLLEKSRVVSIADGERNYHIFYQMLAGLSTSELSALGLNSTKRYNYVGLLSEMQMPSIDDAQWLASTRKSLSLIGIDSSAQTILFQILAGVLLLGELEFGEHGESGSAISTKDVLADVARMFGLPATSIEQALCNRTVITRNDAVTVPLVPVEAIENRDALAKTVYSKLFDWMVHRINSAISTLEINIHGLIGVLDIFGFEDFKQNGFEQFCINYANEKLQQKFTTDVFKTVEDEYMREGIEWDHVQYQDNQGIVEVIDGKMGIIAIMNDHLRQPRGTEEALVNKLRTNHAMKGEELNPHIEFPKVKRTQFVIHHYAGAVTYETVGFMEKHRDTLQNDLLELIQMSHIDMVGELFVETDVDLANARGVKSLGSQFKQSLTQLMDNIATTNTHYVRCIKPNSTKSATEFDKRMVTEQLRSAGVVEAIRITRAAYPSRLTPQELASRYCIMFPPSMHSKDVRRTCSVFMSAIGRQAPREYQMGKTLIYFQSGVMEELEAMKSDFVYEEATCIQKLVLGFIYRRRYARMVQAAIVLQSYARMALDRNEFLLQRDAVQRIQRSYRNWVESRVAVPEEEPVEDEFSDSDSDGISESCVGSEEGGEWVDEADGEWVDEADAYDEEDVPLTRSASRSVIDRLRSFKSNRGMSDASERSVSGRRRLEELSCKAKTYMRNSDGSSVTGGSSVSLEEENAMLRIENRNLKYDLELMREQCIELQAIILAINKSRKR